MVHKIDLDGAERARHSVSDPAVEIDWHGHTYRLPIEQPMEVARHFRKLAEFSEDAEDDGTGKGKDGKEILSLAGLDAVYDDGMSVLFCTCAELPFPDDDHPGLAKYHESGCEWLRFQRTKPSRETKQDLVGLLNSAYGNTPGEARAPRRSSRSTGAPSKRTGSGSTNATSGKNSGRGATAKKAPAKKAAASRQR
jgi:hypothetical protein